MIHVRISRYYSQFAFTILFFYLYQLTDYLFVLYYKNWEENLNFI